MTRSIARSAVLFALFGCATQPAPEPRDSDAGLVLTGHVRLADGSPAAGVEVTIVARRERISSLPMEIERSRTVTAPDGGYGFTFPDRPAGIVVTARGERRAEATGGWSRPFQARGDLRAQVDLQLIPKATVRGTVTSVSGERLANGIVHLANRETRGAEFSAHWIGEVTVSPDGTYELYPAPRPAPNDTPSGWRPTDEYVVCADVPGFAPAVSAPFRCPDRAFPLVLDLRVETGHAVHGRVSEAGSGRGIGGARIDVLPRGSIGPWFDWPPTFPLVFPPGPDRTSTTTDAEGAYLIEHLPSGPHEIRVAIHDGGAERKPVTLPTSQPVIFELRPGAGVLPLHWKPAR